ncbi:MAG: c-type cytochrome [Proteobacteria bacterium]|nr:c-type cytochrome [Pseudomonadota bacterium]
MNQKQFLQEAIPPFIIEVLAHFLPVLGQTGSSNTPMLVRVSLDPEQLSRFPEAVGTQVSGNGPIPVPGLGTQLQDQAIFGAQPEIILELNWDESSGQYEDGTVFTLRKPRLSWRGQAQNVALLNDAAILRSIRQTPPVVGLGLLEAVPDETLLALEDPLDKDGDGIRGHLNRVWDPEHKKVSIGRFGWKASAPSLLVQTAGAFAEDMGVHNFLFPDRDGTEELSPDQVRAAAYYTQTLGVPDRQRGTDAKLKRGEQVFNTIGCASCHRPSLKTGDQHPIEALRNQNFAAYTDLMLHDMGEGLADHRQDFMASGSEWRTSPLWGLGVAATILPYSAFLHDGRARSLEEAILWHGGESEASQKAFRSLPVDSRDSLIAFLRSL